jgi:RNA polymerase sigma-70 factor (ECF subfamily)
VARERDEQQLLEHAVAGDKLALGRLLLPCYESIVKHIARQLPPSLKGQVEVDDLVQQTFVAAIRHISTFEPRSGATLLNWLKRIAENQLRDTAEAMQRQKRGGRRKRLALPASPSTSSVINLIDLLSDHGDTPSRNMSRKEAIRAVRVGVATLAEEQRQAISLHYFEGRTVDSTAAAMERSPGAVRGLLQRARQSLRTSFGASSRWLK